MGRIKFMFLWILGIQQKRNIISFITKIENGEIYKFRDVDLRFLSSLAQSTATMAGYRVWENKDYCERTTNKYKVSKRRGICAEEINEKIEILLDGSINKYLDSAPKIQELFAAAYRVERKIATLAGLDVVFCDPKHHSKRMSVKKAISQIYWNKDFMVSE